MAKKAAFFAVARKFLDDPMWLSEPFTKGQAWLDLIGRASYEDNELTKRGELIVSERGLAARWKWSESKVRRFLLKLEADGMIKRSSNRSSNRSTWGSTISVEKYEVYQNGRSTNRSTYRSTERRLYNNINNINNISLYMPDGMMDELQSLYGDKAEQLVTDVRNYYEAHPDKEFPGWPIAVAQFNSNQKRWSSQQSRKRKQQTVEEMLDGLL